ncbi:MAG: flagellar brake protein [Sphaerotilus sp.]|jgi:flagellar brake protein|nr:flagellar brake protein [Sphaerotilus sp.]
MSPSTASLAAATATAAGAADLHEHRVRVSVEIRDLLRQFVEGDVPLSLTTPDGLAYSTSLWAEDAQRGVLVFAADARDTLVPRLAESHEVTATGYLDSVKVQFDVHDLLLVHGRSASAFNAQYPREVYRFQRRNAFRIRPTGRTQPHALLELADLPRRQIDLRILDISHTGVALMLNEELDLFRAGQCLSGVELVLDVATRMRVALRVMHVSEVSALPTRHRRIGCELLMPSPAVQRELQRYLDHAQKRHRLLSL